MHHVLDGNTNVFACKRKRASNDDGNHDSVECHAKSANKKVGKSLQAGREIPTAKSNDDEQNGNCNGNGVCNFFTLGNRSQNNTSQFMYSANCASILNVLYIIQYKI